MKNDASALGSQSEEKPQRMTRAEFLTALDEVNTTLEKQVAQARENQREINAKSKELSKRIAETHQRLLNL